MAPKSTKPDYKSTLFLPHTEFEMRAHLTMKEPKIQAHWAETNLYEQLLTKNANGPHFLLHDGPPYANGNIHLGQALNKILKDFILSFKNMNGYYCPFIPGWDTHGLPIENAVIRDGADRKKMSPIKFRGLCRSFALKQVQVQIKQFQRLGLIADFNQKYLTLNRDYEAAELELLTRMMQKNLVYRDLKPVIWSPSSESALAESEVNYQSVLTDSIYVAFPSYKARKEFRGVSFLVWTTTPWTIPCNQLLAIKPNAEYSLIKIGKKERYIVATLLLDAIKKACRWSDDKVVIEKRVQGTSLLDLKYVHPLYEDQISTIVQGDHVNLDQGTGIVHIASGFGEDDFRVAKAANLPVFAPINDQGLFTKEIKDPELIGKFYADTNKPIIKRLTTNGYLLAHHRVQHNYPFDWRTDQPVIYRATPQWFVALSSIKDELIHEINKTTWAPEWAKSRITAMISQRNDWCISRQRLWGLPLPFFYTEKGTPVLDVDVNNHVQALIKENGTDIWWEWPAEALLPTNYHHPDSPNNKFRKETDVLDVWFDSGVSPLAVLLNQKIGYPADLILEGKDQFRGWFSSSLIMGVVSPENTSPYKTCLAHGFIVDQDGYKMSKSRGNVIDPNTICDELGADILRLWTATVDYFNDVHVSKDTFKQVSETYRKIRNTFRFLLGNLHGFNNELVVNSFANVDVLLLTQLNELIKTVTDAFNNYDFTTAYNALVNFMINSLSAFYLDFTKDILYIEGPSNSRRRQVQTVYYHVLNILLRLWAPILVHTTEEAYNYFNPLEPKLSSIHLTSWPKQRPIVNYAQNIKQWELLMQLRDDVNQVLEQARAAKEIGKPAEATVTLTLKPDYKLFAEWSDLKQILMVGDVILVDKFAANSKTVNLKSAEIQVTVKKGLKCPRCWQYYSTLPNGICERCQEVIKTENLTVTPAEGA